MHVVEPRNIETQIFKRKKNTCPILEAGQVQAWDIDITVVLVLVSLPHHSED